MTLGEHEQPGRWHVGASTGRLTEPTDLAIGLEGEIYVLAKGLGEFGEAHYMTMAPNGDICVADTAKPARHRFVKK